MTGTRAPEATIEADPAVPIIRITRDFAATPAQLLRAHTDPELFARWVGPDGMDTRILAWDAHALLHAPGRLFQAPIFHPLPDALAFSENLLLPAALVAPATLAMLVLLLGGYVPGPLAAALSDAATTLGGRAP